MKRRSGKERFGVKKLLRLGCEQSGSILVEFAMSALLLMGLLVAVIEFALGMYSYHFLSSAAQEGTRFAIVRGDTWSENEAVNCSTSAPPNFKMVYDCTASSTDIQNYVQSLATGGINPSSVTVNTTSSYVWPGTTPDGTTTGCSTTANSQGCLVKVTVSYSFKFLPFEKLSSLSMSASSEGVILQ
jgi:Flp pilus assembly protein TadG